MTDTIAIPRPVAEALLQLLGSATFPGLQGAASLIAAANAVAALVEAAGAAPSNRVEEGACMPRTVEP